MTEKPNKYSAILLILLACMITAAGLLIRPDDADVIARPLTDEILTLQPEESTGLDTRILSEAADTNYQGSIFLDVGNIDSSHPRRTLIKFNLSSIPANATITSSTFYLTVEYEYSSNARDFCIYRLKRNWVETQATWNSYSTGNSWSTAGATGADDYDSSDIGCTNLSASEAVDSTIAWTLTSAEIQKLIDGTYTNYGFLIMADVENTDLYGFYSSAYTTATYRPKLIVTYTTPATETPTSTPAPSNPGTTGLMGWWSLDETSGTRYDFQVGNHLTQHNGVGYAAGQIGNSAVFVSANVQYLEHVDNESLSLEADTSFTVGAWVYLDTKNAYRAIIGKGNTVIGNEDLEFELFYGYPDDRFKFAVANGSTFATAIADSFGSPSISTWYLVIAWYDSEEQELYICMNDNVIDSIPWTGGTQNSPYEFVIGKDPNNPDGYITGRIDEAFYYKNRVLTWGERAWIWNSGQGRAYSELTDAIPTETPTFTLTPSETPTNTLTFTPTETYTPTLTFTPTITYTPTITDTPTITYTPTLTFTPNPSQLYSYYWNMADASTPAGIAGSVLCAIVILALIVGLVLWLIRRKS